MYDPIAFGKFVRIATTNADAVLKRKSRVVMQCVDWRIEINTGMLEEEAEGLGQKLRKEAKIFFPKPTESNEVPKEKMAVSQLRKEKSCVDDKQMVNTVSENSSELNQFIDLDGPLGSKDILTELNDLLFEDHTDILGTSLNFLLLLLIALLFFSRG